MILSVVVAITLQAPADVRTGVWHPVPLIASSQKKSNQIGGEGGQWPRALSIDATGKRLVFGTDVGGIYRSFDSGLRWEPCNVGFSPRGAVALAIDPNNPDRVLAVGGNSSPGSHHGIYLSSDFGASWKSVFPVSMSGLNEVREQLAFDPTSFASGLRRTQIVYWSRIRVDRPQWGEVEDHPAIYKSEDGGASWRELPGSEPFAGSIIRVHPENGWLYGGNERGLFVSRDKGRSFQWLTKDHVTGIDLSAKRPNSIWISTPKEVLRTDNDGRTWQPLNVSELVKTGFTLRNVKVSPVSPDRLILWRQQDGGWDWGRYASSDGGRSWTQSRIESIDAFLPTNAREGVFTWHPKDSSVLFSVGGDYVSKSEDGGKTFRWSNQGNNGILAGGRWNFAESNPDILSFGSQDYNAAFTRDAGKTWTYLNPSGNPWGGFCYGGYTPDGRIHWVGVAGGWTDPRILRVSTDGGKSWQDTGLKLNGRDSSFSAQGIYFANQFRSTDGGATWQPMAGCDAVLTGSPDRKELFGVKENGVVRSADGGATWQTVAPTDGEVRDIAFDSVNNRIYAVIGAEACLWSQGKWNVLDIPRDQFGGRAAQSVAVDPRDPRVVYVGSAANLYNSSVSVVRSTDSGSTWSVLTRNEPLNRVETNPAQLDGGREALCIRVHPRTRDLWVSTSCYGLWRWSAK